MDINSGTRSTNISNPYEPLEEYYRVKTVTWEVFIDSGLVMPVGIDVMDGRLVITDDNNGDIIFYDITKNKKNAEIGRVKTGKSGIAGITIAPDSTLWYVNTTSNEAVHLVPDTKPAVALIYPEQNATKIPTTDTLRWSGVNATSYRVQLSDASSTIIDTVVTSISLPFSGLKNLTSYSWRVLPMNSEDSSDWSDTSRFTTIAPAPIAVTLLSPANNALDVSDSVTFLWHSTQYATEYHFQLAESATFNTPTADLTFNDTTSYISKLLPSRVYYWRVGAIGEDGKDVWSETWSFTRNSLGVDDVRSVASLSIYPNPASSTANISLSLTEATPLAISLHSLLGENMMTVYNGYGALGANNFTADISKLVAGVYHLHIETASGVVTRQIVVQ
jgi:hypothetical protein